MEKTRIINESVLNGFVRKISRAEVDKEVKTLKKDIEIILYELGNIRDKLNVIEKKLEIE